MVIWIEVLLLFDIYQSQCYCVFQRFQQIWTKSYFYFAVLTDELLPRELQHLPGNNVVLNVKISVHFRRYFQSSCGPCLSCKLTGRKQLCSLHIDLNQQHSLEDSAGLDLTQEPSGCYRQDERKVTSSLPITIKTLSSFIMEVTFSHVELSGM